MHTKAHLYLTRSISLSISLISTQTSRAAQSHHQPAQSQKQRRQPSVLVLQRDGNRGPGAVLVPQRGDHQPRQQRAHHRHQPREPDHGRHGQERRRRLPVLRAQGQDVSPRLRPGGAGRSVPTCLRQFWFPKITHKLSLVPWF